MCFSGGVYLGVVAISWAPSGVALETVMPQKNLTEICILSKSTRFMVIQVSQSWSEGFQSLSILLPAVSCVRYDSASVSQKMIL